MDLYLQELVPGITEPCDDNNYGSAAMQDVLCLQALSKRIHYGKFVAEAKFRADPEQYQQLIENKDQDAIMRTLTSIDVEKKVCCILFAMLYTLALYIALQLDFPCQALEGFSCLQAAHCMCLPRTSLSII